MSSTGWLGYIMMLFLCWNEMFDRTPIPLPYSLELSWSILRHNEPINESSLQFYPVLGTPNKLTSMWWWVMVARRWPSFPVLHRAVQPVSKTRQSNIHQHINRHVIRRLTTVETWGNDGMACRLVMNPITYEYHIKLCHCLSTHSDIIYPIQEYPMSAFSLWPRPTLYLQS